MTIKQQTPIKGEGGSISIGLGSTYATYLGLADIVEWDESTVTLASTVAPKDAAAEGGGKPSTKRKKKSKKKKKKVSGLLILTFGSNTRSLNIHF